MSILVDDKELERLARLVREAFPGRAPSTLRQIEEYAQWLFWPNQSDAENLESIRSIARTKGAEFTRVTPSVSDVISYREAEAKHLGLSWTGAERMIAHREAEGMDDEARLALVPADFKTAPAPEAKPAIASSMSETERLDAEILKRTGKDPRQMLTSERQRWHVELRNILATPAPKNDTTIAPLDPKNPERARDRINAFRREQAAKRK